MKFMIKKPLILNALSTVGRVFQTSKVALPILNNFKISVSKDNLIIVAANGETTIQTKIDTTDENGDQIINVDTEGEFLLNNRSTEMIRKLAGSDVEFDLIDNSFILISDGNSEFRLNSERVKEYPDLDLSINKDFVNLDINQFIKAVNQVSFAASNKEMANILSAVNIKIKDKKLIMSATDANRLSRKIIDKYIDKYGKKRIEEELYKRFIPREVWRGYLDACCEDMSEQVLKLLSAKMKNRPFTDRSQRDKTYAYFVRRGYDFESISKAFRRYGDNGEFDD